VLIVYEVSSLSSRFLPALTWPIIAAVGLLVFALVVDGAVIVVALHFIGQPTFKAMPWYPGWL
jgi:uncharacterized membrane protein (DUF485 family)